MSKKHRKFELEEKLQILQEGENHGVDGTCRKYQISCSLFYNWKNKSDRYGPDEFARQLGISRTSLYELLDELKSRGAPIEYSKSTRTFFYRVPFEVNISCTLQELSAMEEKNILGGVDFFRSVLFSRTLEYEIC